jgi:hypothetical protein
MTKRTLFLCTVAIAASGAVTGQTLAGARGAAPPPPPASDFSARVDNPWYPLTPGTRYVYVGVKDGRAARDVVTVTHRTKAIQGVPCVVVDDRLYLAGRLAERTTDWYTEDRQGNVWYFGEQTAELDAKGRVTTIEGSWQAGVGGAEPGIFMPAHPRVGRSYRQEFYAGHAEDHVQIIGLFSTVTPPTAQNTLLTKEWTPLEPEVIDRKVYVRGIGQVVEQTARGGDEHLTLVSLRRGS